MEVAEIGQVWCRKLGKVCLASRAELARGNGVVCKWESCGWIPRNRGRAGISGATSDVVEITTKLSCCRHPRLTYLAAALSIPLFGPEEEELVPLDRAAYGIPVV